MYRSISLFFFLLLAGFSPAIGQETLPGSLEVNTSEGHELVLGSSGFNVRIADKVWSYTHPEFREAVHTLKPGWLRYFSGTMGDAFSSATGMYNLDYAMMMDHASQYYRGNRFLEVKGPHRIIDLYHLLGEVQGKLVITINGFTETPEMTRALARFCKDNNIVVDVWQFCNEPYFYVPNRSRYWWNDGYDYAQKMKPHAEAIQEVYPDAKLALNFTWDGIWDFMKEINQYQVEKGAYWNVFSKHSYAPHVGGKESFDQAMRRANTKVIEATTDEAMAEIEEYTAKGIPMLITEFGVWNAPLNGIFSGIYNAEYTLRQLAHPNAFLIGSHEVSNKIRPATNRNELIEEAYRDQRPIDTDTIMSGTYQDEEGKGLQLIHMATNNSKRISPVTVTGARKVPGLGEPVESVYASYFEGINGEDYLAITNRSGEAYAFDLKIDGQSPSFDFDQSYIWSAVAENKNVPIENEKYKGNTVTVKPYSVSLVKWKNGRNPSAEPSRIYNSTITDKGINLEWWKREMADAYEIAITDKAGKVKTIRTKDTQVSINSLEQGQDYSFEVYAIYGDEKSEASNKVMKKFEKPSAPKIFKISQRDKSLTLYWESATGADGYQVTVAAVDGGFSKTYDAKNVFGYRVTGLDYDRDYKVSLKAYNGLGETEAINSESIMLNEQYPIPARNISATETMDGKVYLEWIVQDTVHQDVRYNLYKGSEPHQFERYAENIEGNHFIDDAPLDGDYFYTVKAVNQAGETAYYPNIATVIKRNPAYSIYIDRIENKEEGITIYVKSENLQLNKPGSFGVKLNDVSFLNLEEMAFKATESPKDGEYSVHIPWSELDPKRSYFVKAYAKYKNKEIISLPPFQRLTGRGR